jgi:hypothetical protein
MHDDDDDDDSSLPPFFRKSVVVRFFQMLPWRTTSFHQPAKQENHEKITCWPPSRRNQDSLLLAPRSKMVKARSSSKP